MHLAVLWDRIDVLRVLLEHDRSLGYVVSSYDSGTTLLNNAAYRGHVGVARELLKHCPDAPHCDKEGDTRLHTSVWNDHMEFVEFVQGTPQLWKLVNLRNPNNGDTALHLAVSTCHPKMVDSLLLHQDTDVTVLNNNGDPAIWTLSDATNHAKTLNWVCIYVFLVCDYSTNSACMSVFFTVAVLFPI
jgi:ankyrin repeat protein